MIERADWTDDPPDTPAPAPAKSQSINRPNWEDGPPEVPEPAPVRGQAIIRPDWNEPDLPVEVNKSEARPDWPIEEPAEAPNHLVIDEPAPPPDPGMVVELTLTDDHDLESAHGAVQATLDAMPDRAGFESSFDSLPAGAQQAILSELALSPDSPDRADDADEFSTYASDDELEHFATTQEGSELVQEWGSSADHKLGIVQARLLRMEDTADLSAAWEWFDSLSTAQAKAVLRGLAE